MMKNLLSLCLAVFLCTACTALPAEERAFAVALMVERDGHVWRVHGRIPTYQGDGGYMTITGMGDALSTAMADLEAAAPMHVNLSQLRLLLVAESVAQAGQLATVLQTLSDRPDMRPGCALALTAADANDLMPALEPPTGARLSKALDVLLQSAIEQGSVLPSTLSDVLRMGERQTPVLMALNLRNGQIDLNGGYPIGHDGRPGPLLSPEDTALLTLLTGRLKALRLSLDGVSAQVRDASARVTLADDLQSATFRLTLRSTSATCAPEALERRLADLSVALLSHLYSSGCDVLGLGRQAILRTRDMPAWHALDWPGRCRELYWQVSVRMVGPT